MTTCIHSSEPGSAPLASAAESPARTMDDLPLPEGPTTPSSVAPGRRATSSATSCSRPKNASASATSKLARPLYGQTCSAAAVSASTRPRARWRSTTLLVRSAWAARSSWRPTAARSAACSRRRLASARSHSATISWTRSGTPPVSSSTASSGSATAASPAIDPASSASRVGVEWLKLSVRRAGKRRARGGEHECRRACDSVAGMAHGVEELLVRRVEIVEDEQDGRRHRAGLGQRRSGGVAASDAAHVPHLAALRTNLPRQLGCETGLTHAPRPGDHGHLPRLVRRPFPCFA